MSTKSESNKAAAAPPRRRSTEPAFDLFDSLQRGRLAKRLRQRSPSPADDHLEDSGRRDDE